MNEAEIKIGVAIHGKPFPTSLPRTLRLEFESLLCPCV
jgi:hypothetical protein